MSRTDARLYTITLRAAARTVGSTRMVRGQSFTVPFGTDIRSYRNQPLVWDVKITRGATPRTAPAPQPGTKGGPSITPRAQAVFTGLVNRLSACAEATEALTDADRAGYQAMVASGDAMTVATLLARALGGTAAAWSTILAADVDELGEAIVAVTSRTEPMDGDTDPVDGLDLEPAGTPDVDVDELDSGDRGDDADGDDADAVAEAVGRLAPPVLSVQPPPAAEPVAAHRAPAKPAAGLDELRDAVAGLLEGREGCTMKGILELARAAGIAVPPELSKMRKRDEFATRVAQLLAAHQSTLQAAKASPPSAAELEG